MKKISLLLLLAIQGIFLQAQAPGTGLQIPKTAIKAAYLGSVAYPGFKIGVELPYKVIQIEKAKRKGVKTFSSEYYLSANLGYYHHTTFHDNFFLLIEWQKRRQKASGWFWEMAPGAGYSRTFLGRETYTVSDEGIVDKKTLAGYNYALISFSYGGGYNFSIKKKNPLKTYGKISLLGLFPYNSFIYLRPTVEVGIAYSPTRFWNANPNVKNKKK
ncbi:MAG: hypothetical protein HUU34_14060 [Saprospiraceae bacterium]|nr:hypothetical protein [Saprospiraceae bacterium]